MKMPKGIRLSQLYGALAQRYFLSAENRKLIRRFLLVCLFIFILILVSSYLVWKIESTGTSQNNIHTFWDSIWWAIVTIATVGYGDKVPLTQYGRVVGLVLIGSGVVLLSVFSGLIASLFVEDRIKGAKGLKQIRDHNHIVICGWNKTGDAFLKAIRDKNLSDVRICIISNQSQDFFESLQSGYRNLNISFVKGEPTQEDILRRASVQHAARIIILADMEQNPQNADERSIIVANAVHYITAKAQITVQLLNANNKTMLLRLGIKDVMVYDDLGGSILANSIAEGGSLSVINSLLQTKDKCLFTRKIDEAFVGKSYGELFDHYYTEDALLLMGLISRQPDLDLESIFSDSNSAIDQFIKSTLSDSPKLQQEDKNSVRWNPPRTEVINDTDHAIIFG